MYPAYIGKIFLNMYNQRQGTANTARQFFEDVIFPLFFDAEKHFINVSNSSFFQPVGESQLKESGLTKPQYQLQRLHESIGDGNKDGSTFVGFAARDQDGTTSGQVSSLDIPDDDDTVYASWIGAGFGIATGDLSFYCNEPDVMWSIFNGWKEYRKLMNQTPQLKGNQVETWNAWWIWHVNRRDYVPGLAVPLRTKEGTGKSGKFKMLETNPWQNTMFALCRKFKAKDLMLNVYSFGSTNTTVGFIPLQTTEIHNLMDVWNYLIGKIEVPTEKEAKFDLLYKVEFNFRRASERGAIGLTSLEPKDIRNYLAFRKLPKKLAPIDFLNFQTWIIAMLNNTEMYELAARTAKALRDYEAGAPKAKSTRLRDVEALFEAKGRKNFIEALTQILATDFSLGETFNQVVDAILKMPQDNFPLFAALIRFQYQLLKPQPSH